MSELQWEFIHTGVEGIPFLQAFSKRWCYQVYEDAAHYGKWTAHREPETGWWLTEDNLDSLWAALRVCEDWYSRRDDDPDSLQSALE
jgi:hypothetical protein